MANRAQGKETKTTVMEQVWTRKLKQKHVTTACPPMTSGDWRLQLRPPPLAPSLPSPLPPPHRPVKQPPPFLPPPHPSPTCDHRQLHVPPIEQRQQCSQVGVKRGRHNACPRELIMQVLIHLANLKQAARGT